MVVDLEFDGITADEEDEGDDERIRWSWEENGVVLQENDESEEPNKDDEGDVSSDSFKRKNK